MKKYLNEEAYLRAKKKLVIIATSILVVGLVLSMALFIVGFNKKSNPKDTSQYESQVVALNQEISTLDQQISNEFMNNGFSSNYYSLQNQRDAKQSQKIDLESKIFDIEHDSPHVKFFGGGAFILVLTLGVAGTLYFIAYRRNILAFSTQQVMPVAKEGMEEIAPSIGKISEEITKGISKGKTKDQE